MSTASRFGPSRLEYPASRLEYPALVQRQGRLRAYGLALLMHALLLAGLTWGVSWHSSDNSVSVEAELWSAVPQEAAPKLVEPEPKPEPQPEPPPPPPAPPKVENPGPSEAEIALQKERDKQAKEKAAQELRDKQRLERERQEKLERDKQERDKKLAEEKRKKELEAQKLKEQQEAEQRRQENIKRMAGLANATGKPTATGNAAQSAGPSANYAGRIRARIKPNIVFSDELSGNPVAEVEVRTSPDGTIVGRKLLKSSGNKAWDDAVLKAIDKTDTLPRNEDGVVPSPMNISFRPKD